MCRKETVGKMKYIWGISVAIGMIFVFNNCGQGFKSVQFKNENSFGTPVPTQTPTPSPTLTATPQPTVAPTATPTSTPARTPTPTSTPTSTPTPTPTPTPSSSKAVYSTNFPASENPISESGKWINGKAVGLNWHDVQTIPGRAYAASLSDAEGSRYADSIACINPAFMTFAPNQYARGVVYRAANYNANGKHEIELHLRWQTVARNARGYEVMWGITGYLAIVRWNGSLGDYTTMYDSGDPGIGAPRDGDVLMVQIAGSTLRVYKNGSLVNTTNVTAIGSPVYSAGQPGMGFWPVENAVKESFGWKSFEAGDL